MGGAILSRQNQAVDQAILVRVSIPVVKRQDQKQLGEKGVYFILHLVVHHLGGTGRNSRQEPGGRNPCTGHEDTFL